MRRSTRTILTAGVGALLALGAAGPALAVVEHTNPPLPVEDSTGAHADAIALSVNGGAFAASTTVPLTMSPTAALVDGADPNAAFVVSPGDAYTGWVDVRNDGPGDGVLEVTFAQVLTDAPDGTTVETDDFFLDTRIYAQGDAVGIAARDLRDGDLITRVPIAAGETVRVQVGFEFPWEATSGNTSGGFMQAEYAAGERFVHYDVHLRLSGEAPATPKPDEPGPDRPGRDDLAITGLELDPLALAALVGLPLAGGAVLLAMDRRRRGLCDGMADGEG